MICKKLKSIAYIIVGYLLVFTTVFPTPSASATGGVPDDAILDFYNANGIFFYNPAGGGYSINCLPGNNLSYNGSNILEESQLNQILTLQPIYEEVASRYGFDWRILAAIHYRESNNSITNPNSDGVYQIVGKNYTPGHTLSDEEFQKQTDDAAQFIINKASGLDLSNSEDIKELFFRYNGTAQRYKDIALAMGFTEEQANRGEGSPYVMNWYDSRRDPRQPGYDENWVGGFINKTDSNGNIIGSEWDSTRIDRRAGAFTVYVALGGGDSQSSGPCYPAFGGGALVEGGMTMEQAEAYMEVYRNLDKTYTDEQLNVQYGMIIGTTNVKNGFTAIHNCVAFVQYFLAESTIPKRVWGLPDGAKVVGQLLNEFPSEFTEVTAPTPYAIFSRSTGTTTCGDHLCGHTGVILGVQGDTVITGEAAYNSNFIGVKTYTVSEFMGYPGTRLALPNNLLFGTPDGNIIADGNTTISGSGDNITVTIPGLAKSYKIAWVSDAHVQSKDDGKTDTDRFEGRTIDQINQNWENAINNIINASPKYDAVIFGGDLMDYYSNNTSSIIQSGLDKITQKGIPWLYIYGGNDHDQNGGSGSIFKNQPIDLGDIVIIGLDNSSSSSVDASSTMRLIDSYNKPIILATHVPFDDPSGSVNQKVTSARSADYLWTTGGSHWDLNSNSSMNTLANNYLYQNSNVKLVLAGHVHTLSYTSKLGNGAQEHIFQGNYRGNGIGVINIRGN